MKKKRSFLLPLLMAVVMMAMSPQRMWADDYTITVLDGTGFSNHNSESCECCRHLFDGTTDTKWCSKLGSDGVYVIFKVSANVHMTEYSLTDGNDTNDFYGRHWKSWTIYGANFASDDLAVETSTAWTAIDSRSDQFYDCEYTHNFTLSENTQGYQYYMVRVTGVGVTPNVGWDECLQTSVDETDIQQMSEMTCTFVGGCGHTNTDGTSALGAVTHHDATCIQGSYDAQVCSLCNNVVFSNPGAVDTDAHAFGDVKEAADATCIMDGNVAYKECTLCHKYFDPEGNELQDYVIPATGHTIDGGKCAICNAHQVQIGTGSEGDSYDGAYYTNYKYTTTITLYKGSEIGESGKISRIAYKVTSANEFSTNEVKIYMMEADELFDVNKYVTFDWSKFKLVYTGNPTLGTATGWEWLTLNTPFKFNFAHNLLIAVCRKSDDYTAELYYAVDEDASSNRMIYNYSDNDPSFGQLHDGWFYGSKSYTDIQLEFAVVPTLDTYDFVDGKKYDTQVKANTLTYTRTFGNTSYNALYVPFAIPISALSDGEGGEPKASIYSLLNIFEEDTDDDGTIDKWVLKVVRMSDSESTEPNTPYIIKPAASGNFSLTLSDIKLAEPMKNSLWCASTDNMFTFTGVYSETGITQDQEFFISTTGGLQYAASDLTLAPQRWYMTINDKETGSIIAPSTFNTTANNAKGIRIAVEGEDETTSINNAQLIINNGADTVYNLYGQKLTAPRKGVNIVNGRKIMVK